MSKSNAVHRPLRLTSPNLKGEDIAVLQRALNRRAKSFGIEQIDDDGEYGPLTDHLAHQIAWLLGIGPHHLGTEVGTYAQKLIRDPNKRNKTELKRSKKRIKDYEAHDQIIDRVLDACRSHIGEVESPPNSNRGPWVSKWQREFGIDGQPWCGAFVGYYLRKVAAIPVAAGVVYTPNIIAWGHAGTNGMLEVVSWGSRKPGDLILYKWPGVSNDACDHVGILDTDRAHTIEGNTSSGDSGSQNNGGGVYRRDRGNGNVVAVVRPRY